MKRLSNLRGQAGSLLHGFCRAKASCGVRAKARSIGGRLRVFLRSDGEGQSLVEFALTLPMLLMVLLGIFTVGIFLWNYQQLSYATNQGLVTLQQLPDTPAASDPCSAVATAVIGAAWSLQTTGAGGIQLKLTFGTGSSAVSYPSSGTASPAGFTCSGSTYAVDGEATTLQLTYPCSLTFYGISPTSNCKLNATVSEQI
jgi:Flp pilus assembly protein TadG